MPFNSYEFLFGFLPITLLGYWRLLRSVGRTSALLWLLLASVVFYAYASLTSLAIIVPSILLDYGIAQYLLRSAESQQRLRKWALSIGILANVLFLAYFKYKNFFLETSNELIGSHFELERLILPLGISFLVFQKIAFLEDVYSGQIRSVPFLEYLLFTLFFPRTVAGPIVHYQEIMPQLAVVQPRSVAPDLAVGIALLSIGLFKKTVIADNIGQFVAPVFDASVDATGSLSPTLITSWAALLSYIFQLYFDFSGYSDMALGVARMLGVRLPMNFNSPFKARSIVEFWSRWHITLTRFLTAYVYTPLVLHLTRARLTRRRPVLQGRRSKLSTIAVLIAFPTMATMAISGLWHGAGWQFVLWGVLHGIYLTLNQGWRLLHGRPGINRDRYDGLIRTLECGLTFGCVTLALVFFRASSVASAFSILGGLVGFNGIFPPALQFLHSHGSSIPWPIIENELPLGAFWWILGLFPVVMLLPNSLELLRQFQPALDFPSEQDASAGEEGVTCGTTAASVWEELKQIPRNGVRLSPMSAAFVALLCVLAVMALTRGGGFLYGQF